MGTIDHAEIAAVVAHLLEGDDDRLLASLDESGWWELWEQDRGALAATFFAVEGRRGRVSPALAGFLLRLLEVSDVEPDVGMVVGTDVGGLAGTTTGRGSATIHGLVLSAASPARLVIPVRSATGAVSVVAVDGLASTDLVVRDHGTRALRFASGTVAVRDLEVESGRWSPTWRFARRAWATSLVALAEAHLEAAVEYCASRQQFGRVVGSFQAVKHHLARVKVAIETAHPVVRGAWRSDTEIDTLAAKALGGACYLEAHNRGIRVMGGMGYSLEHPIGRFHRLGLALEAIGGSTRDCHRAVGALVATGSDALRSPIGD